MLGHVLEKGIAHKRVLRAARGAVHVSRVRSGVAGGPRTLQHHELQAVPM